jgi:hypothetical protein
MRWLLCLKLTCLTFLIALPVSAGGPQARSPRPASAYPGGGRINVRVYNGDYSGGIRFHTFGHDSSVKKNPCFPYSCEGISGPITNPDPRTEDEKPACYYGVDDVLFFEKEGSTCPYIRPPSRNAARVEKRRQEHLAREAAKKKSVEKPKP